jgi:glycolate oxidase iron-sulfur subunit
VSAIDLGNATRFVDPKMFLDCVHCGLCLNACPTYVELGTEMDSPRGRIYLMRQLEEGTLPLTDDVARHLDLCLGCRACETACPSGVRYGELIEAARSYVEANHERSWLDRVKRQLMLAVFPHPRRLRLALAPLFVLETLGILPLLRSISGFAAMLPRLRRGRPLPSLNPAPKGEHRRVALLAGCVGSVMFAGTNRATVRVLNRNNCTVVIPKNQVCCGALYLHAGAREAAAACARSNIDAFGEDAGAILVNAAGCGAIMKEYGALLADDPAYGEKARVFSARVKDVTEYLVDLPLEPPPYPVRARVTYHDACHLAHGQGVRAQPRSLLRSIKGVTLVELPESEMCCGSAGSYNLTEPAMAQRLGLRKAEYVRATGANIVAVANPGCALQIQASLRRAHIRTQVMHPIELLDRAYGPHD